MRTQKFILLHGCGNSDLQHVYGNFEGVCAVAVLILTGISVIVLFSAQPVALFAIVWGHCNILSNSFKRVL